MIFIKDLHRLHTSAKMDALIFYVARRWTGLLDQEDGFACHEAFHPDEQPPHLGIVEVEEHEVAENEVKLGSHKLGTKVPCLVNDVHTKNVPYLTNKFKI